MSNIRDRFRDLPRTQGPRISILSRSSLAYSVAYRASRYLRPHRSFVFSHRLVEADGIEPTTSCLQSTRSPN